MTDNILLLIVLVCIGLMNLMMTFILNIRKCKQEIKNWEALHHMSEKFHYHRK